MKMWLSYLLYDINNPDPYLTIILYCFHSKKIVVAHYFLQDQ